MCDDFLFYIPHDFCKFFLFTWIIGQPVGCLLFWVYTWLPEVTSYVKYFHIGLTSALHSVTEPVAKIILPDKDWSCCTNLIFMVSYEAVLWQHVQINFIQWFPAVNLLMIFVQFFFNCSSLLSNISSERVWVCRHFFLNKELVI